MPKQWIPDFTGKATPEVAYALQELYRRLSLDTPDGSSSSGPSIASIRAALQANGSAPLNVNGLLGRLSNPQPYSDPPWTKWTPTVTCSAGVPTTATLEAAYLQTGKTVRFRIYWNGTISLASMDVNFTAPAKPVNITGFQTAASWYHQAGFILASAALINDATNLITIRSVANFPAATNMTLIIEGVYEGA